MRDDSASIDQEGMEAEDDRDSEMSTRHEMETMQQYEWASKYLADLIQGPPSPPPDATDEEIRARAISRIERLRNFLAFLGDPQLSYRTVHVAGTSGKGSTCAFLASMLTEAGYRTGLHVSPYLQVETEKLQINDRLMSAESFARHIHALDQEVQRWTEAGNLPLTYGEFWVALTFYSFAREGCEFVVTETGAGGRFDLTNLVQPEVSVITSVGLDHVRTLGETIPEIAWHKAGIIKQETPAITTSDDPDALAVIRQEASEKQAPLTELQHGRDYSYEWRDDDGGYLTVDGLQEPVRLPLPGPFQAANAAVAVRAIQTLQGADGPLVSGDAIRRGIEKTRFPGRVEIPQRSPLVVLDGAHNPEKVSALVSTLDLFPKPKRRILVLGSLGGHDFLKVAEIVAPQGDEVIITAPSAIERPSAPVEDIVQVVESEGRSPRVILDPQEAIQEALNLASEDDQVVVTGSLYLVGAVREHWYPTEAIVTQQTPWPEVDR